jgi:TonB family protein
MSLESKQVSGRELVSLQSCLVGGDPEQRSRERRVRRRALVISIATQSVMAAAIVLVPLFAKPARIALNSTPLPPYYAHAERRLADSSKPHDPRSHRNLCRFCAPTSIPPTIPTHTDASETSDTDPIAGGMEGPPGPRGIGEIPLVDTRVPTQPQVWRAETPRKVHVTQIDPAMLTRRIEPIYPTLMKQLGRSGQIQLRAVIGTDGTIQSLQVVSGDPGFYQSALEAVRQWRYRPTVLNGNPVEVDTFITVIYNISR